MSDDSLFFTQFITTDAKKPRGYAFTWNNYTESDIASLQEIKCQYITFAREVADSGTPHLQGYIYFENPRHVGGVARLYNGWHIEPVKGAPSENIIYIGKEAERYERGDRPKDSETKAACEAKLWERMYDAAKEGRMSDIPAIHYVRYKRTFDQIRDENRPVKKLSIITEDNMYEWQRHLKEYIDGEPDQRKILWYCDVEGGRGKSEMVSYLHEQGAQPLKMGKYADMAYAVPAEGARVFLFNIARQRNESVLYDFLEDLKDGNIHSTKYVPVHKRFARPHVVVFSNETPDETKMSSGRFDVVYI